MPHYQADPDQYPEWKLEPGRYQIILLEGETTWNPTSTSRPLCGPSRLSYRVHEDGGIDVTEYDLPAPGARVRYAGPTLEPRPGAIGLPHGARGKLITWDAGTDPDGRGLALFEWAAYPGSEIYINRNELEPITD